jgi:hypothetical protein
MMLSYDRAQMQNNRIGSTNVEYPSYKSFDDLIDLQHLRSLDSYLTQRIHACITRDDGDFFCNQHTLEKDAPYQPGVREIWLTRTPPDTPYNYLDIDRTDLWRETPEATDFALLMDFVRTLPFKSFGRILLIFDRGGNHVPAHRDHEATDICHDFIWFRTNVRKPFYLLNHHTGDKLYVSGYSAWFDTVNQFHGSDAVGGLSFSFRVDGHFDDEFKKRIPYSKTNPASTPAVWASLDGGMH